MKNDLTREEIRRQVVNEFLEEIPGTGIGESTSKYRYDVERLSNGNRIYLKRPAFNNKGFDFEIHVEGEEFGGRIKTRPRHEDIVKDLELKKNESSTEYDKLKQLISKVFNCQNISNSEVKAISFKEGLKAETLLLVIKWLFIEQDVTYWNYSGRQKFMDALNI
ncbi:DNA adenine methylase [Hyphobacterium sp. CCMP332]|nr:DNA adenine methylase [Hyphobacterium sp. CCMP332]